MLRAEQMNLKPLINLSFRAGSTGDTRVFSGWRDLNKSLFEIGSKIKVSSSWMLMRMGPLLTLLCKTWLF